MTKPAFRNAQDACEAERLHFQVFVTGKNHAQNRPSATATPLEFARLAALRWDADQPVMELLSAEKLLTPIRHGDAVVDLRTTFNVARAPDSGVTATRGSPGPGHSGQPHSRASFLCANFSDLFKESDPATSNDS